MRRKRPPALSFLLRIATARRVARVVLLLALDFAGVALAIFTALVLKEARARRASTPNARCTRPNSFLPFAYLLTALLFARSGLYAERALRPGLSRIVGSLFQVAFVALIFAVVSGEHFSSYYLFYGSLAFAIFYVSSLRARYERVTGVAAARRRLPAAGGARRHRQAHPRRRPRARRRAALADRGRRLPRAASLPRSHGRCARSARWPTSRPCSSAERIDEVIIADPDFPQDDAVELVDQCHQRGVRCASRRRRWRS